MGENGGVHWHPMMLLERWLVAAILGVGLISTTGAPGQSQAGAPADGQANAPPANPSQSATPDDAPDDGPPVYHPRPIPPADAPADAPAADQPPAGTPEDGPPAYHPQPLPPADAPAEAPPAEPSHAGTPADEKTDAQHAGQPSPPAGPVDPKQQQLEEDTAQMLQLVQELKVEVEKAGSNTLSLAALRKADEIQRLARSLKERIREREQAPVSRP